MIHPRAMSGEELAEIKAWALSADDPSSLSDLQLGAFTAKRLLAHIASLSTPSVQEAAAPIDMILFCPRCGRQHVDEPDDRTPDWTNPPHRSHLCHNCNFIWRPADVATNGVLAIKTRGKKDMPYVGSVRAVQEAEVAEEELREQIARAIYDRDPFHLATAQMREGVQLAVKVDWDSAPSYYQHRMLEFADAAMSRLRSPRQTEVNAKLLREATLLLQNVEDIYPVEADLPGWLRDCRERIEAIATAESASEKTDDWQKIDTAPKDGTIIIIGRKMDPYGFVRAFGYWADSRGISGWVPTGAASSFPGVLGLAEPTHWMRCDPPGHEA